MFKHAVLTAAVIGAGVFAAPHDASAQMTGMSSVSQIRISGPRIATPRHFNGVVAHMSQGQRTAIGQTIGGKANDGAEVRAVIKGSYGNDMIVSSANW